MAKKKEPTNLWRNKFKTATQIKTLSSKYQYIVFFDTETTGLKTDKDRIIQISAIKTDINLNEVARFNSYCNPYPMLISPQITEITGITQSDVENASMECDVIKDFNVFSKDAFFVAYNSKFDNGMLLSAFGRAGINRTIEHFDAREISYDNLPHSKEFTLSTICNELKISGDGDFHNAMYDVEMMFELFKRFYNTYLELENSEITKPKVHVFALNPWSMGKNKRLYVPTSCGTFYYDMIKKHWGEKDATFAEANMIDVEEQAMKLANIKGSTLNNLKESVSYRDL